LLDCQYWFQNPRTSPRAREPDQDWRAVGFFGAQDRRNVIAGCPLTTWADQNLLVCQQNLFNAPGFQETPDLQRLIDDPAKYG
jgi:hypothetical protein